MNEIQKLAEYAEGFRLTDAPEAVQRAARYCVLDSIGSALGAVNDPELQSICGQMRPWYGKTCESEAAVWGQGMTAPVPFSLLFNGMMAHALELDDVHTGSKSHVGAVVVTSAWTLCDALKKSGRELLEAVIVGYEIMARVGLGMDIASNRRRGWHTTGIIGTFGSAAVCARLLGLNAEQTAYALGIAGSQSAGLWAFLAEGATCKKLSPARAAANGFAAAILARGGMTGPLRILDAEDGGLYRAVSDGFDLGCVTDGLGTTFEILKMDKKPYPCCRTTHHAIDAALKLRSEGVQASDIAEVLVETYDVGVLQCGFTKYPESYVEARFSIPYTAAAAFVCGRVTLSEFKGSLLEDPTVRFIAAHTRVEADPMFTARYPGRWGSRMTVTLWNGSKRVCQIDDMSGSTRIPLSDRQEREKFLGLAEEAGGRALAEKRMKWILECGGEDGLPELK